MFASPIARLVQQLGKLPGIGEKTAARLAFHILRASPEDAAALAAAIAEVKQKIRFCSRLLRPDRGRPVRASAGTRAATPGSSASSPSPRTSSPSSAPAATAAATTCSTACCRPSTASAPTTCAWPSWSPLRPGAADGRRGQAIREAILATSPSVEGEATAVYLAKLLRPLGVRATRIATGVPDRRRAGVRRPGDAGARHRRPPRNVGGFAPFTDGRGSPQRLKPPRPSDICEHPWEHDVD